MFYCLNWSKVLFLPGHIQNEKSISLYHFLWHTGTHLHFTEYLVRRKKFRRCVRVKNLLKEENDLGQPIVLDGVAISLCKDDVELLNKSLVDPTNNNIAFEHAIGHWQDWVRWPALQGDNQTAHCPETDQGERGAGKDNFCNLLQISQDQSSS